MTTPTDHAFLSCSGAHRWMACPGAPRLEAQFPRSESIYATEGTTAHALLETALLLGEVDAAACLHLVPGADDEMAEHVQPVLEWVRTQLAERPGAELFIERRVDPGKVINRDDLWGTCDVLILDLPRRTILVGDLKYGVGYAVEATNNVQLKLYGLGAMHLVDEAIDTVTVVVLQPRAVHAVGPIRTATLTREAMEAFSREVQAAAEATEQEDALLVPGEHCVFCRAKGGCSALADHALAIAHEAFRAVDLPLTPERVAYLLGETGTIRGWLKALEDHALQLARSGIALPGWKLASRRGHRAWINQETALTHLVTTYGVPEELLAPRALISPAQVEATVKKTTKQKADLSHLVRVPDLGPRLVKEGAPGGDAFEDVMALFAGLEETES